MKILITGGLGFLGSNLCSEAVERGNDVIIIDNLFRAGSKKNIVYVESLKNTEIVMGDVRKSEDVESVIKRFQPDVVFHVAGQVAMTTSIENPRLDFEINALGTFNILEAIRKYSPSSIIIYSSSNKVYGDLEYVTYEENELRYIAKLYDSGFPESLNLEFHSPYGCSKGCADQYMLDYHRIYGLKTVVLRHSSMYGAHQHATFDQGWIGYFLDQGLMIKNGETDKVIIHGSGKQVRDVLYVSDMMSLYFAVVNSIDSCKGNAFNIGGGMRNSLSLLELFKFIETELNIKISIERKKERISDQKVFVADISKITEYTGWKPLIDYKTGLREMLNWLSGNGTK